jgi:hypothetical protein
VLLIHFDSLHQATDDLPSGLKIRLLQPIVHFGGKGFQASHHETQLFLHLSLGFEVCDLSFQVLQPVRIRVTRGSNSCLSIRPSA